VAQAGAWSTFNINQAETEKLLREVVQERPNDQSTLKFLALTVLDRGAFDRITGHAVGGHLDPHLVHRGLHVRVDLVPEGAAGDDAVVALEVLLPDLGRLVDVAVDVDDGHQ